MTILFIHPNAYYNKAVVLRGNYSRIADSFKDFMEQEEIEGADFLVGNYGIWEVYLKYDTQLIFQGTLSDFYR